MPLDQRHVAAASVGQGLQIGNRHRQPRRMQIWRGFSYRMIQLCSDGLFKTLPEPSLAEMLAADQGDTAERLLAAALARANVNVTAVTVEVLADG